MALQLQVFVQMQVPGIYPPALATPACIAIKCHPCAMHQCYSVFLSSSPKKPLQLTFDPPRWAGVLRVADAQPGPGIRAGHWLRCVQHPAERLLPARDRHVAGAHALAELPELHQVRAVHANLEPYILPSILLSGFYLVGMSRMQPLGHILIALLIR